MTARTCPCGSAALYDACCGPLLAGDVLAGTAEQLMRSRYTAYAVGDVVHLLRTWHPSTRPAALRLDPAQRWTRLDVLATEGGGLFDREATVRFRAHSSSGVLAETSRFVREDGRWSYVGVSLG